MRFAVIAAQVTKYAGDFIQCSTAQKMCKRFHFTLFYCNHVNPPIYSLIFSLLLPRRSDPEGEINQCQATAPMQNVNDLYHYSNVPTEHMT